MASTLSDGMPGLHLADPHDGHFFAAFLHSVMMVVATELGDKTFFIAAILAMSRDPGAVFLGAWGALAAMTALSAIIGLLMPTLLSVEVSHWFVTALFFWFGGKALWEAREMYAKGEGDSYNKEEMEETEELLKELESNGSAEEADAGAAVSDDLANNNHTAEAVGSAKKRKNKPSSPSEMGGNGGGDDSEKVVAASKAGSAKSTNKSGKSSGKSKAGAGKSKLWQNVSLITSVFTMTFLAEWGDKSQIATIAMGAARDCLGVVLGGIVGHAMCTGLAVQGGRMLATSISERSVVLASGAIFVVFGAYGVIKGPES